MAASAQNDAALTDKEQITAGYALLSLDVQYFFNGELSLRAGIDNLLNREYQNHLGGYNRIEETEILAMFRLPSEGLSAWAEITYSF